MLEQKEARKAKERAAAKGEVATPEPHSQRAWIEGGLLHVEVSFNEEGKTTASRKSKLHATTERNGGLVIDHDGVDIKVQVNAYSQR